MDIGRELLSFLICVKSDSRFQTLKQLIDEARAQPGMLKYGSAGVGSILHTTVELIGNQTKTQFLHVPYRGEAPALTGMLTGDIDFIAATTGPMSERVRAGEFRALAVTGKTRWRDFPNVPTVAETVIPGFEVISWTGLAGPANLPKPVVERLERASCGARSRCPTLRANSRPWAATPGQPRRTR